MREHPSASLLAAQLVAVLLYPFADTSELGRALLGVLGMVVLALALWAVHRTPALTWVTLIFGVPALVLTLVEAALPDHDGVTLASAAFHVPFYFYVSYAFIRYLFDDATVTRDELFATGAAFTVVAWGFTYLFVAVQVIWPGSFVSAAGTGQRTWFELLFLSFTTLTSVGLSDVVPVLSHARSVVMVEQVAGVFYVALVVARLVGLTNNALRSGPPSS